MAKLRLKQSLEAQLLTTSLEIFYVWTQPNLNGYAKGISDERCIFAYLKKERLGISPTKDI
ncbi:hypothetical protein [Arenibacter sp. GZD-96]|uniref:hypothetical protein n=1 Tax=Aurantibrevibacter litoralis TaxID=3106030 RepID=UPI002AFDDCBD|nr:hypothetical protein [Arenibacter sp. GZD-96]